MRALFFRFASELSGEPDADDELWERIGNASNANDAIEGVKQFLAGVDDDEHAFEVETTSVGFFITVANESETPAIDANYGAN